MSLNIYKYTIPHLITIEDNILVLYSIYFIYIITYLHGNISNTRVNIILCGFTGKQGATD